MSLIYFKWQIPIIACDRMTDVSRFSWPSRFAKNASLYISSYFLDEKSILRHPKSFLRVRKLKLSFEVISGRNIYIKNRITKIYIEMHKHTQKSDGYLSKIQNLLSSVEFSVTRCHKDN